MVQCEIIHPSPAQRYVIHALENMKSELERFEKFYRDFHNYLFDYKEKTLLDFFNKALLMSSKHVQTLNDFPVWNCKASEVYPLTHKAPLLVMIHEENPFQIWMTAIKKEYVYQKNPEKILKEEFEKEMKLLLEESANLFEIDKAYFSGDTYTASIVFEKINWKLYNKYLETINLDALDFYAVYRFNYDEDCLAVYGQIKKKLNPKTR